MQSALNLLQPGEEALVLNASHTMNAGGEEQVASVLRAVLDANVFVSAAVHPEGPPGRIIERFLRTDTFTIALSPGIVEEALRALAYPKVRRYLRRGPDPALFSRTSSCWRNSSRAPTTCLGVSRDPDDDQYLAAAVEGRATVVVTGDPHLPAVGEYEGVRIVSPRAFLDRLGS